MPCQSQRCIAKTPQVSRPCLVAALRDMALQGLTGGADLVAKAGALLIRVLAVLNTIPDENHAEQGQMITRALQRSAAEKKRHLTERLYVSRRQDAVNALAWTQAHGQRAHQSTARGTLTRQFAGRDRKRTNRSEGCRLTDLQHRQELLVCARA